MIYKIDKTTRKSVFIEKKSIFAARIEAPAAGSSVA